MLNYHYHARSFFAKNLSNWGISHIFRNVTAL
jgi:hypothetical protein